MRWSRPVPRGAPLCAVLALLVTGCAALGPIRGQACAEPPPPRSTAMSVPYWNLANGTATARAHASALDVISPWVYGVRKDGGIALQTAEVPDATMYLEALHSAGPTIMPTIANHFDGDWQYETIATILRNPALTDDHVQKLVEFARQGNYRIIDIDYEELQDTDGPAFTRFVRELADRLHADGRSLSVTVSPKTSAEGHTEAADAQDYTAIGAAADSVRLMTYDFHWSDSEPGAVAPTWWVHDVVDYARSRIPLDKLVLGVPAYGYDWSSGVGSPVSSAGAVELAQRHGTTPAWDDDTEAPWFTYNSGGVKHVVWYEDARSTAAKLMIAREFGLHTVHLWVYGPEDPGIWDALDQDWKRACLPG